MLGASGASGVHIGVCMGSKGLGFRVEGCPEVSSRIGAVGSPCVSRRALSQCLLEGLGFRVP